MMLFFFLFNVIGLIVLYGNFSEEMFCNISVFLLCIFFGVFLFFLVIGLYFVMFLLFDVNVCSNVWEIIVFLIEVFVFVIKKCFSIINFIVMF